MKVSLNRQIGSIFFIVGIEVGAGILALPIVSARIGFLTASIVMVLAWFLMTYTALILCEINLALSDGASFTSMAQRFLGKFGQFLVFMSFLGLLYTIIVAYISAAGSSFSSIFHVNYFVALLIFVILLGAFVVSSTSSVDWLNRVILGIKSLLLLFACIVLLSNMHGSYLKVPVFTSTKVLLSTMPVFVTIFTSHLIVPTLRTYLNSDHKVITRVFIIGGIIPLILYFAWVIGIMGVIPLHGQNSFASIFNSSSATNIGDVLNLLRVNIKNPIIYSLISWFSTISVATSFLGTSLALFHFVIDGFRLNRLGRFNRKLIAAAFTFAIPLIIVYYFPNVFIKALSYVGLYCTTLLIILPFFMLKNLKKQGYSCKLKYIDHPLPLHIAFLTGCFIIISQVLSYGY